MEYNEEYEIDIEKEDFFDEEQAKKNIKKAISLLLEARLEINPKLKEFVFITHSVDNANRALSIMELK